MERRILAAAVLALAAYAGTFFLFPRPGEAAPAPVPRPDAARGRYLVDGVAMCSECHTPRDSRGELDRSRDLQGAPIWITPVRPRADWANRAPALAGLESYTDAQMEAVLERGEGPNGLPIQSPMHVYAMSPEDARAVIAYLRSLAAPSR